jgi:hypothetical protein
MLVKKICASANTPTATNTHNSLFCRNHLVQQQSSKQPWYLFFKTFLPEASTFSSPSLFTVRLNASKSIRRQTSTSNKTTAPCGQFSSVSDSQHAVAVDVRIPRLPTDGWYCLSGLKGKALNLERRGLSKSANSEPAPADCFKRKTSKSLGYLAVSMTAPQFVPDRIVSVDCTTLEILSLPVWELTVSSRVPSPWVLRWRTNVATAPFPNKNPGRHWLYPLHHASLAFYYSWQRSHAIHHQYTNHMDLGET